MSTESPVVRPSSTIPNFGLRRGDKSRRRPARGSTFAPDKFFYLLDTLSRWCHKRADRVAGCYLSPNPDDIGLHIVTKAEEFDFELNRELADLCTAMVRKGFPVHGTLMPTCLEAEADLIQSYFPIYELTT